MLELIRLEKRGHSSSQSSAYITTCFQVKGMLDKFSSINVCHMTLTKLVESTSLKCSFTVIRGEM